MIALIDAHCDAHWVEPICRVLALVPSTYHGYAALRADPSRCCERVERDGALMPVIEWVWREIFAVCGVRTVWRQLRREGFAVTRCSVACPMAELVLEGAVRGKLTRTTVSNPVAPCPLDRVNRQFRARRPNALWLSDLTYVATWAGFVYVALVIDAFARRIVVWQVPGSLQAGFVLDALEQALHDRRPVHGDGLIHHSDQRVRYVSIKYTESMVEAGIEPSVGSIGDSDDKGLVESVVSVGESRLPAPGVVTPDDLDRALAGLRERLLILSRALVLTGDPSMLVRIAARRRVPTLVAGASRAGYSAHGR